MYALLIPARVVVERRREAADESGSRTAPKAPRRRSECEALDRLVADVLAGRSRVTVLRGEVGVGKSALLGYLSDQAAGWHVARAGGVESEMELAYAGLHQLCTPMLDHLGRLPAPQHDALATVFGRSARGCAGPVPGRAGHAHAVRRGRRAAAAGLCRRRRAVARPRLGADPGVRSPAACSPSRIAVVCAARTGSAMTFSPGSRSCPCAAS
jgi:Predicted ATPase